ncbi:MAG: aryl-sulfate sulfotransferase, partial [bacterium]
MSRGAVTANPSNVLSAFVMSDVRDADSALVRFGMNAVLDDSTPAFTASGDSILAPVLGLFPSTTYHAQVVAFNRCGSTVGEPLPFETGRLPNDLPVYTGTGTTPSPGYVALAAGNYGLVIDNVGRVVWYRFFPNGPGLNFQPQPNGTYAARPPVALGEVASWLEIAPDGSVARTVGCARGLPPRMHDMIAQTDGSYWLLCDDVRTVDLSAQGKSSQTRVMGTSVQWRSATGDVLFEWSPFDHFEIRLGVLDPVDLAGPVINWTHGNALDLDRDGNLLVSFRNLSEVTK